MSHRKKVVSLSAAEKKRCRELIVSYFKHTRLPLGGIAEQYMKEMMRKLVREGMQIKQKPVAVVALAGMKTELHFKPEMKGHFDVLLTNAARWQVRKERKKQLFISRIMKREEHEDPDREKKVQQKAKVLRVAFKHHFDVH